MRTLASCATSGKIPFSWSSFRFQIENHRVNLFVSLHHGIDRKVLPDTIATGTTIDFRNSSEGPNCFSHVKHAGERGSQNPCWRTKSHPSLGRRALSVMLLATVSQAPYCRGGVRQVIGERIATLFLGLCHDVKSLLPNCSLPPKSRSALLGDASTLGSTVWFLKLFGALFQNHDGISL